MPNKLSQKFPNLSRLGLGTAQFGASYGFTPKISQAQANVLLDACRDSHINFLDTARAYGDSEEMIGKAAGASTDFVTATKLETMTSQEARSKQGIEDSIRESIRKSCEALKVDKIALLLLHQTDDFVAENDYFWEALKTFEGRVQSFGISVYEPDPTKKILQRYGSQIDFVQAPYNIFDRRFEGVSSFLKESRIAFIARSVFLKGVIGVEESRLGDELNDIRHFKKRLSELSEGAGLSENEAALLFVSETDWVDHILFGAVSANEIKKNVETLKKVFLFRKMTAHLADLEIKDDAFLTDPRKWKTL